MNERQIYGGAMLSAASLTVSCILVTMIILARNAGAEVDAWVGYALIGTAVLLIVGIFTIIYKMNADESTTAASPAK
ncbi:MAG: hypothetical protein II893_05270 [Methanomicrobium sp.]|nr:hypothetical protein [Methanomicrobium sp.]MBQ4414522.1 hypothetical protein [Methanomicrobium sp.]